jgi:uncharacterized protein YgiM (DUF1202 family)
MLLAVAVSTGIFAGSLRAQVPQPAPPAPQDTPPPIVPADDARVIPPPPAARAESKKNAEKSAQKKEETRSGISEAPKAPKSEPAVAMSRNVNVRGQANINSEIVTHLKQGELVTVLDEVTLKKAKPDEPAKWAKIALPAGTPVWVSAHFVDRNTKTVTANRLRLRSGPGENYSTLGMINKGTVIKELETKGDWIKIEAGAGAYAFVAAHLLSKNPADLAPALARANPPTTAPSQPENVPPTVPSAPTPPPTPPPTVVINQPPPVAVPTDTPPPTVTPPAVPVPPPAVTAAPGFLTAPPAVVTPPAVDEPLPKRMVTREGMVRGSASIQAPSYYVLKSLDNNRTINYLHSPTTNIVLKEYQYQRVLVTGEELLDERWPHTPVIDIETIQTVP